MVFFSQRILLELTNVGFLGKNYKIVQSNAMKAWKENSHFTKILLVIRKL